MRATGLLLLLTAFVGICVAQDTNFPVGPQYLITTNSTLFLRPIGTPSLSFEPMPAAPAVATQSASSTPSTEAYLPSVYWGENWVDQVLGVPEESSVIEISSTEPIQNLPASLFDSGVAGMSDAQSLRERGYGEPMGDTAKFWKARKPSGTRVYTNDDVRRLHGG